MTAWRRPSRLRLLASLLILALTWALFPSHAHAHGAVTSEPVAAVVAEALDVPLAEVELGLPCGPQMACSPTILLPQLASPVFVAPWRSALGRLWHDRRTHLHRHGHEPPPPRLSA